ncbi:hypothetical protein ACET3Z_030451 [Daucus carota]
MVTDEFDSWNPDLDHLRLELQARKQRESALEAALAEKELTENEIRKKVEEGKKREAALENDLANMWVLVAQLKKEVGAVKEAKVHEIRPIDIDHVSNPSTDDGEIINSVLKERQISDVIESGCVIPKEEPLVARLKARLQEMKEKELTSLPNGDVNSHLCKTCYESTTTAMLLPCQHFCFYLTPSQTGICYNSTVCVFGGIFLLINLYVGHSTLCGSSVHAFVSLAVHFSAKALSEAGCSRRWFDAQG